MNNTIDLYRDILIHGVLLYARTIDSFFFFFVNECLGSLGESVLVSE